MHACVHKDATAFQLLGVCAHISSCAAISARIWSRRICTVLVQNGHECGALLTLDWAILCYNCLTLKWFVASKKLHDSTDFRFLQPGFKVESCTRIVHRHGPI
jgi:hypothetical protein